MGWKNSTNDSLRRLTGYELRKPVPKAKPKPKARPKPKPGPSFPKDYDEQAIATIKAVKPFTMTSPEKLNGLIQAVRYITAHQIPGDIVECGVWRGGSMQAVARTLLELDDTSRDLYLFDTFEGMPPPTEKDRRHDGKLAADMLANSSKDSGVWAVAGLEDVQTNLTPVGYPEERIHYRQGLVEETVPAQAPEQIAILRLDTDWYESTKHELDQLYPRLSPGGVLIIDDYGWWQGSREAVEEFLKETGARLLLLRIDEGRIAVKP